ncbi:ubiquinol-cytochrome c reductase iron-sulfur subunit [Coralloluteibacterium stylophorae]|uniref:Ubiquinol-cytochrome c reductase iron-sulfur subunit n=1 Tax=Coralloluteibacterium stylophorae TaxID=1776034 RepID=A0A8J7VXC7_9GAMM|nr:ubiquinol-cytochrome c reductase iron-sulfur subunit [Coralloluteibacterium stylophorae]MBS7456680.1 ubiquinol-cytochrome c reductase iron-sulfur subunit [Coralloluteibacterium stylophorae]
MAHPGVNNGRRRFLTASTAVVGAVGAGFVATPFIKSWLPSARTELAGAPADVDIGKIDNEPGMLIRAEWRGQPIFVFKRSQQQIDELPQLDGRLVDPNSDNADQTPEFAKNPTRSIRPEIGVLVGICTHLGCVPLHRPEVQPQPWDANWQGGFFCPCHSSFYDLAGRVYQGVPAPANLRVPPYRFEGNTSVVIGEAPEGAA